MLHNSDLYKEINHQPVLWKATYRAVSSQKEKIASFLKNVLAFENPEIILTGAGSSAFIGQILSHTFYKATGRLAKAIPTTDLVTHPDSCFNKKTPTLLISFARSGDSPESIASFELAERLVEHVWHLIITCNGEGRLAEAARERDNAFVLLMPDEANDQALAMTGAFTSMTLAGFLTAHINDISSVEADIERLIAIGTDLLKNYSQPLSEIAGLDFNRVVFLGSGPLKGAANESHLKVLELTDGQVICQYESFLGFRHGPRAVIDASTLLVYLFSADPYIYKYELDLVRSVRSNEHFVAAIGIGQSMPGTDDLGLDLVINTGAEKNKLSDDLFAICSVIPAQIIGYYKSVFLGLTPDSPSQNGGISRIVQGVTIYPF